MLGGSLCDIEVSCRALYGKSPPGLKFCYINGDIHYYVNFTLPINFEDLYLRPCKEWYCSASKVESHQGLLKIFPNLNNLTMRKNVSQLNSGEFIRAMNLTALKLQDNNFGVIKRTAFAPPLNSTSMKSDEFPMHPLHTLLLSQNSITEIEPHSFYGLTSLWMLSLSLNELTVIRRGTFAGLPSLKHLYFFRNKIETIEEGALDLPALLQLNLNGNNLKQVPDNVFSGLPKLEQILLSFNDIEKIGQSLCPLKSIEHISLKWNFIEDLNLDAFAQLPNLRKLELSRSGFSFATIELNSGQQWNSSLLELDLANNNLTDATQLTKLRMFPNLQRLDISQNSFADLELGGNRTLNDIWPALESVTIALNSMPCESIPGIVKTSRPMVFEIASRSGTVRVDCWW